MDLMSGTYWITVQYSAQFSESLSLRKQNEKSELKLKVIKKPIDLCLIFTNKIYIFLNIKDFLVWIQ